MSPNSSTYRLQTEAIKWVERSMPTRHTRLEKFTAASTHQKSRWRGLCRSENFMRFKIDSKFWVGGSFGKATIGIMDLDATALPSLGIFCGQIFFTLRYQSNTYVGGSFVNELPGTRSSAAYMNFTPPYLRLPSYRDRRRRFKPYERVAARHNEEVARVEDNELESYRLPPLYSVSLIPGPVIAFKIVHPLRRVFIDRGYYVLVMDIYADRLILTAVRLPNFTS
ncbi:hypothetical protein B0H10DRAFT_1945563 [Mycena sp. CBHHK59/15]|nr:hypothetical protein B0H10DRAFT_1945563 [Mycena sp. CBHHK59/15]